MITDQPRICSAAERLGVLSQVRFFAGLSEPELREINTRTRAMWHPDGEAVYRVGEPGTCLFVVAAGAVKLVRTSGSGQSVLLEVVTPGGSFGALGSSAASHYGETARSLGESCILRLAGADSRQILRKHPSVALAALDDLADRLEKSHQVIRQLSADTVEQRVAATLLGLDEKLSQYGAGETGHPRIPLSRGELASMAGTTPETVSRVMSQWRAKQVILSGRRWTTIRDYAALTELAAGNRSA
ncbi:MAG TPA: Crp/Fnr family transcriptional regulator [Arthrobacter sp.]|jgi:CRP-like cAMP-binding protein|nr:Crp/Fnr family transcriptional regulator [Arthrobacter sp.]